MALGVSRTACVSCPRACGGPRWDADHLVLPVENTLTGSVGETHTPSIACTGVIAVRETVGAVHHCLLAPHGLRGYDFIGAQPSARDRPVSEFSARTPPIQTHGMFDTAGAAREVAQLGDPSFAAWLPNPRRGINLAVLVLDIEDRQDNQTRFLLSRANRRPAGGTPARTMIVFTTKDAPGALLPHSPFASTCQLPPHRHTANGRNWRIAFLSSPSRVGNVQADAAMRAVARASGDARRRHVPALGTWRPESIGWSPTDVPVIA